jgi:hypothetical protein
LLKESITTDIKDEPKPVAKEPEQPKEEKKSPEPEVTKTDPGKKNFIIL